MAADFTTWLTVLNLWKKNADDKILEYLTCIENSGIILQYLSQTMKNHHFENMTGHITFQDIDRINIFFSIIARHAKNNQILEYILINFEELKPR